MKFGRNPIENDLVRVNTTTDGWTDGQAQNNRDNILFASLLIGLSVEFLRCWHVLVRVARARVCGCVRVCVRLYVCYC